MRGLKSSKKALASLQILLKIFLRSKHFASALLAISILASVFITTSSIGTQVNQRLENQLPAILGTKTDVKMLHFNLYSSDSGCIATVNSSSFAMLTNAKSAIVGGRYSGASNMVLEDLPSLLDYCILINENNFNQSDSVYVGNGSISLQPGNSSGFVKEAANSLSSLINYFWEFGLSSVIALSVTAWSFALQRSRNVLRIVEEHGLDRQKMLFMLLSIMVFASVFSLSIIFSLFVQNISIGIVDFVLGSSFLYSGVGLTSLFEAFIMSLASSFVFIVVSSVRNRNKGQTSRRKGLLYLLILIFLIAFTSSLTFLALVSSSSSLDYVSLDRGNVIIPANTQFPLTSFFVLPKAMNCSSYSAEIAYPAAIDNYRTIVRGLDIENSSYFYSWQLVSGNWPNSIYQVALGDDIAATLHAHIGDKVSIVDELTGNSATFIVSGIYKDGKMNNIEAVTGIDSANAMTDSARGQYSYVRVARSCINSLNDFNEASPIGISQLLSRILLLQPPQTQTNLFSLFSGLQPLVNSMSALALAIVAGTTVSIWYASEVFISSSGIRRIERIRWEQGDSKFRLYAVFIAVPALIACLSIASGEILSALVLNTHMVGSVFYQQLIQPGLIYFAMLFSTLELSAAISLYNSVRRFEE